MFLNFRVELCLCLEIQISDYMIDHANYIYFPFPFPKKIQKTYADTTDPVSLLFSASTNKLNSRLGPGRPGIL